jgi:hypothetical protein
LCRHRLRGGRTAGPEAEGDTGEEGERTNGPGHGEVIVAQDVEGRKWSRNGLGPGPRRVLK